MIAEKLMIGLSLRCRLVCTQLCHNLNQVQTVVIQFHGLKKISFSCYTVKADDRSASPLKPVLNCTNTATVRRFFINSTSVTSRGIMSEQQEVSEKGVAKECAAAVVEEAASALSTEPKISDGDNGKPAVDDTGILAGDTEVCEGMEKVNIESEVGGRSADCDGKSVRRDTMAIDPDMEKCSTKNSDDANGDTNTAEISVENETSENSDKDKMGKEGPCETGADTTVETAAEDAPKKSKNQLKREKKRALYNQMKEEYKEKRRQKKLLKEKREMEEIQVRLLIFHFVASLTSRL